MTHTEEHSMSHYFDVDVHFFWLHFSWDFYKYIFWFLVDLFARILFIKNVRVEDFVKHLETFVCLSVVNKNFNIDTT